MKRRHFLRDIALASTSATLVPSTFGKALASPNGLASTANGVSFFIVGDTHYCADAADVSKMNENSARYNAALVQQLNQLPGAAFPAELGGGTIAEPLGVIHAGDIVDNADKGPTKYNMAETEAAAFVADWGLDGNEGKLRWPVREVYGNHDSPHGDGPVISLIKERNKVRNGLANVSDNGRALLMGLGRCAFCVTGHCGRGRSRSESQTTLCAAG